MLAKKNLNSLAKKSHCFCAKISNEAVLISWWQPRACGGNSTFLTVRVSLSTWSNHCWFPHKVVFHFIDPRRMMGWVTHRPGFELEIFEIRATHCCRAAWPDYDVVLAYYRLQIYKKSITFHAIILYDNSNCFLAIILQLFIPEKYIRFSLETLYECSTMAHALP